MTPPNLPALQADPASLVTWMESNLLLSAYLQNVAAPNGLAWVTIGAAPQQLFGGTGPGAVATMRDVVAVDLRGVPAGVYALRANGTGPADALRSYVCNYTANDVESIRIGSQADFVFTITLNGCTYGIGPAAGDGSRLVSHANRGGNTQTQRTQTWTEHGVPANSTTVAMLEPANYRRLGSNSNLNATVFGVRTGRNWHFYFQLYERIGTGQFRIHGVFPIRTG